MAQDLLFYLNKLQDVLNLPRTTHVDYPVDTDTLHSDTILTEDIWEASKSVTADLGRRGILEIEQTSAPIVSGTNTFVLPDRLCRLISVEYFDGTYWQGPLEPISYDQFARMSSPASTGTPVVYTTRQNDSREVYWTGTATDGTDTLLIDSTHNFTTTVTGNQIQKGDIVFNTTTDAQALVDYLMVYEIDPITSGGYADDVLYRTKDPTSSNNAVGPLIVFGPQTDYVYEDISNNSTYTINIATDEVFITDDRVLSNTLFIAKTLGANQFAKTQTGSSVSYAIYDETTGVEDYIWFNVDYIYRRGDIISQPDRKTWMVIKEVNKVQHVYSNTAFTPPRDELRYVPDTAGGAARLLKFDYTHGTVGATMDARTELDINYIVVGPATRIMLQTDDPLRPSSVQGFSSGTRTTGDKLQEDDGYQVESGQSTLDTLVLYPIPDRSDTTGIESLKINYIAYPEKPNQSSDKIELSDVFADSVIAKAIEYSGRRETGRAEPYEIAVRKAINAHRPLSTSSVLSQQPFRSNRPVAYFKIT